MSHTPLITTAVGPRRDLLEILPAPVPLATLLPDASSAASYLLGDEDVRHRVREAFFSNVPSEAFLTRLASTFLRASLTQPLHHDLNEASDAMPADPEVEATSSPLLNAIRRRLPALFEAPAAFTAPQAPSSVNVATDVVVELPDTLPRLASSRPRDASPPSLPAQLPAAITVAMSKAGSIAGLHSLLVEVKRERLSKEKVVLVANSLESELRHHFSSPSDSTEDAAVLLSAIHQLYVGSVDDEIIESFISTLSLIVSRGSIKEHIGTISSAVEWFSRLCNGLGGVAPLIFTESQQRRALQTMIRLLTWPSSKPRDEDLVRIRAACQNVISYIFSTFAITRPSAMEELCEAALSNFADGKSGHSSLQSALWCLLSCVQRAATSGHDDAAVNKYVDSERLAQGLGQHIARELWRLSVSPPRPDVTRSYREGVVVITKLLVSKAFDPVWPAALLLIGALARAALAAISAAHSDDSLRAFCLKVLCLILLHERQSALAASRVSALIVPKARTLDASEAAEDVNSCPCGRIVAENTPGLDCDRCHRWFHPACVGLDPALIPNEWRCDACELWTQLTTLAGVSPSEEKPVTTSGTGSAPASPIRGEGDADETVPSIATDSQAASEQSLLVTHHLLLEHIRQAHGSRSLAARRLWIARWAGRSSGEPVSAAAYAAHWKDERATGRFFRSVNINPAEFERTLLWLEYSESSAQSAHRQREEALRTALILSLADKSTKQRARGMRALAQLVAVDPAQLEDAHVAAAVQARLSDAAPAVREASLDLLDKAPRAFLVRSSDLVAARTLDRGLAVRKKAVTLARDLCLYCESEGGPEAVARSLCARIAARMSDAEQSVRDLVQKHLHSLWFEALPKASDAFSRAVRWRTSLMCAVVAQAMSDAALTATSVSAEKSLRWLGEVLKKQLDGSTETSKMLDAFVANTVSRLLGAGSGDEKVSAATLAELFARASPKALLVHAPSLAPLMTTSDPSALPAEQQTQQLINARLAAAVSLALASQPPGFGVSLTLVDAVVRDLTALLYAAHGASALPLMLSCVRALCSLVGSGHAPESPLQTIFDSLLNFLKQYPRKADAPHSASTRVSLVRALYVLSALCRYHEFSAAYPGDADRAAEAHQELVYAEVAAFYRNPELTLKLVSLRALSMLFTAYPHLATRSEALLRSALTSADKRVKQQAVACLEDWLADEEQMLITSARPLDTSVTAPLLQRLTPDLQLRLCDPEPHVRAQTLALIELAVRRRILHPLNFTGYALALTCDSVRTVSDRAVTLLELVKAQNDAAFVFQRVGEALQLVLKSLQLPALVDSDEGRVESSLSRAFTFVGDSRSLRQRLVSALVGLIEQHWNDLDRVAAVLTLLVALPFRELEEVLALVQSLSKLISYQAVILMPLTKRAGESSPPGAVKTVLAVLKAKRLLKQLYGVSSARCAAYDPSASEIKRTSVRPATEQQDLRGLLDFRVPEEAAPLLARFKREVKEDELDSIVTDQPPTKSSPRKRARSEGKGRSKGRATKRRRRNESADGDQGSEDEAEPARDKPRPSSSRRPQTEKQVDEDLASPQEPSSEMEVDFAL